jgi:RNA polymerase sigma-70 factor (ECF subfamily)
MVLEADSSDAQQDRLLVKKVQSGDKRAFDILVIKYQHRIMALISRYIQDSTEVQDIAQEVFIKAYRALADFRGDSAFYTWLYRIAVNTSKNHLVTMARRPPTQDVDVLDAEQFSDARGLRDMGSPDRLLQKEQLETVVYDAIKQLPDELREAILLREMEGLSYEQIATVMSCPIGTVRSRIFRAREAIDKATALLLEPTATV